MNRGLWAVVGAFILWGVFPLYWHALHAVPSMQIMAHRIVWCALLVAGGLTAVRGTGWITQVLRQRRLLAMLACSSVLISINWGLYIWAVNNGHVVESALGYFINPLINIVLGVVLLRERLNTAQWASVAAAAAGVAWLTWHVGHLPWIALALACSFGTYGLIRKLAAVDAIAGLGIESLLLLLPGLAYLLWSESQGTGAFGHGGWQLDVMLAFAGALTAIPLIWFAYGARRIPLSLVGIIQYLGPTIQLLLGIFFFHETFTQVQLIGFSCIWAALVIYAVDGLLRGRRARINAALAESSAAVIPAPAEPARP